MSGRTLDMLMDVELQAENTASNGHSTTFGPRIEASFNPVNNTISAGKDVNFYQVAAANVTVNKEAPMLSRLKAALNPVTSASYDSYEANRRTECFSNTRVHVLNDIEAWISAEERQAPIYVLYGVAGIGKSTIAQTIAVKAASQGILGASFFFSRDEELRKVAKHFFPTIAYQIACYAEAFAHRISSSLDQTPDAPEKLLQQQLSLLLLDPLRDLLSKRTQPLVVVVDAMDECEERAHELMLLLGANAHLIPSIKFLITTRPEWHLRHALTKDHHHEIFRLHEIGESIVQSDIHTYLQFHLSAEEISKALPNRRTKWEPTESNIKMLCSICGTLFIIAATTVKFILDPKRSNPQKQLSRLLDGVSESVMGSTASKPTKVLDETYIRILCAARSDLDEDDEDWFCDYQKVLGALITLANPLPCQAMAALLGTKPDDVEAALSQLHSLVAPSGSGDEMIFRIHHKSFPDFITDKERIERAFGTVQPDLVSLFWINTSEHHLHLAKACFRIMDRTLKHNMAGTSSEEWYRDNKDIPHLTPKLISQDLEYAVLHWASHLLSSQKLSDDGELQACLDAWASNHIMTWIEVLSVLDRITGTYEILQDALNSLVSKQNRKWRIVVEIGHSIKSQDRVTTIWTRRAVVQELLSDTYRFVQQGSNIMELSPMYVYRSCLPFVPKETRLYRVYNGRATLKCTMGFEKHWDHLIATLAGHSGPVHSIAFSSDGALLASASDDNTVRLWNAKTGARISTLDASGHPYSDWVHSVVFSPDNSLLASGSNHQTVNLWNANTGAHISSLVHSGSVTSVTFSINSSQLASGSVDHTIRIWEAKTGTYECVFTLTGHSEVVNSVNFSLNGLQLASGSDDMTVRLWEAKTGGPLFVLTGHSDCVSSVKFSGDSTRLASSSLDCTIRLWDASTGAHTCTLNGYLASVNTIDFSNDGSFLASGSDDSTIKLWEASSGSLISTFRAGGSNVTSVTFSNDRSRLASASYDHMIRLWDVNTLVHVPTPSNTSAVISIAFSSDGTRLVSVSEDNLLCLWDTEFGSHPLNLTGHLGRIQSAAFSNNGFSLASYSNASCLEVRLWNANTGSHISTHQLDPIPSRESTFSNDCSRIASGYQGNRILLWDIGSDKHILTPSGHTSKVISLAFSCDDLQLASGSEDHKIYLWDAKTGIPIHTLSGLQDGFVSIQFSTDGLILGIGFLADDTNILLWKIRSAASNDLAYFCFEYVILSATFIPPHSEFRLLLPPDTQAILSESQVCSGSRISLLMLVRRKEPSLTGLIIATMTQPEEWDVAPICWFPPHIVPICFSVHHPSGTVALGCLDGRVLIIDLSSNFVEIS